MGSPVRTEGSSSDLATAWLMRRGEKFLTQALILIRTVPGVHLVGCKGFLRYVIFFLSRITTSSKSISSLTSVILPSNFLDNKLLFILTLKREWHCSGQ